MTFRRSILALAALGLITLAACEDDPILQPQQQSKPAGGSYSRIITDSTGTPSSARAPIDPRMNPERF